MAQFITVEEHFLSDNLPGGLITLLRPPAVPAGTEERLRDTGKIRLQSMDENNIKFSVLSHLVAEAKPSDCPSILSTLAIPRCLGPWQGIAPNSR
ncbi:2-amino-3-carboxymuconate-6-semialdehyde decarboxylase [Fusarium albosuccineum]|uniref:2-amino-3-carboxymuconate-6-semialdehyde decarboxylase n=1 Tax=Fusarium albosuccineum TaxID=1237068 RepID=A0A8H4K6H2_9HYPO|nr:2-amino-3-carboxymuconate-6-semialdehyde decarboxylase [Fusarium albosuccineum]